MIKIHWTHLVIIMALVVGIFIGSQMQFSPTLALAQTTDTGSANVAITVYSNTVFVVRGDYLYAFKMIDHPMMKNRKNFTLIAKTEIEKGILSDDATQRDQ